MLFFKCALQIKVHLHLAMGIQGQYRRLESEASYYRQPVEVREEGGNKGELWEVEHEALSRAVLSCCKGKYNAEALNRI